MLEEQRGPKIWSTQSVGEVAENTDGQIHGRPCGPKRQLKFHSDKVGMPLEGLEQGDVI